MNGCLDFFRFGSIGIQVEVLISVTIVHPQIKAIVQFEVALKINLQFVALQLVMLIVASRGDIVQEVIHCIDAVDFDHGIEQVFGFHHQLMFGGILQQDFGPNVEIDIQLVVQTSFLMLEQVDGRRHPVWLINRPGIGSVAGVSGYRPGSQDMLTRVEDKKIFDLTIPHQLRRQGNAPFLGESDGSPAKAEDYQLMDFIIHHAT